MNEYKPVSRPAAFGAVSFALTAMTIVLAVVLPAKMSGGSHELSTYADPLPVNAPGVVREADPIRIDVVASRNPSIVQVHTHLNAPKSKQASDRVGTRTAAPGRLVESNAGIQPALCPYRIKGNVAATS